MNCPITSYGNGVFHFDCVGRKFGTAFGAFKADHPKIQSIVGDGTVPHGCGGYWVSVEEPVTPAANGK
ncbi:MAG: hypothetical protein PHT12_06295 [Patescibacteria group bacterium]|nr:hypothetical protein [Patescibacteria group bacterium]